MEAAGTTTPIRNVSDTALWVAAYVERNGDRGDAARSLQQFVRDMGPSMQHAFAQTVQR